MRADDESRFKGFHDIPEVVKLRNVIRDRTLPEHHEVIATLSDTLIRMAWVDGTINGIKLAREAIET